MSDLISREVLYEATKDITDVSYMAAMILCVPAVDAVEVVRRKDCEAYQPTEGGKPLCVVHQIAVCADDYCSYGERRESEVSE